MRLIDADKYLEKVCTYKETGCGSCKLQTMCPKDAPTVKTVPIYFLGKWFGDNYNALTDLEIAWEKENEQSNTSK